MIQHAFTTTIAEKKSLETPKWAEKSFEPILEWKFVVSRQFEQYCHFASFFVKVIFRPAGVFQRVRWRERLRSYHTSRVPWAHSRGRGHRGYEKQESSESDLELEKCQAMSKTSKKARQEDNS